MPITSTLYSAKTGASRTYTLDDTLFETTEDERLARERRLMICTPAQIRLALHHMDLLETVQSIADSDPEASIVWEYATQIDRTSPLIDALGGPQGFTPEQVDDIFRAAMAVET